jgi:hypothetical protein
MGHMDGSYSLLRDVIECTYPNDFRDFSKRMYEPGGFYRGNGAHERIWHTPEGKAVFTTTGQLNSLAASGTRRAAIDL